jgi:DNA-binding CsgD family transcriptional regulator
MSDNTDSSGPPLLVGRERELAVLRQHLDAALKGHGSLVLINGEAGIGKTALAEAVCREASEQDALTLIGRCYDLGETPPYGPWTDLFALYQASDEAPPLPSAFAAHGSTSAIPSQETLIAHVRDFLRAVAMRRPLVLVIDDLHWADRASLDLLRFAARGLASLSLLIIATYRADEVTDQHPLAHLLPTLIREANAARLSVPRLTEGDVQILVARRYPLAERDQRRFVAYLLERGEGNPFFIGEVLHTLEEIGVLRSQGGTWTLGDLQEVRVPSLVRQVIRSRLARLTEDAQRLLAIAALIGQEVPLALWATITGESEETPLTVIERAGEAHLLEETPETTRVRFAHALIRETLVESLPLSQRRRWHRQIGEALAARPAPDPDAVAYHFRQAGDERAVTWLIAAAERARRAYAHADAADRFAAALALQETDRADPSERGWLLYRLGAARRFGKPEEGVAPLDEAVRIGEAVGNRALAAEALTQRGLLHIFCGDFGRGVADVSAGIALLEALSGDDRAEWARRTDARLAEPLPRRGVLIINLAFSGRYGEAHSIGERFVSQVKANRVPPDGSDAAGYYGLAQACTRLGCPTDAERTFAEARAIYRAIGHHYLHAHCAFYELRWLWLTCYTDRIVERQQLARDAETTLKAAESAGYAAPPRFARAPLSFVEGQWRDVRADAMAVLAETQVRTHWRDCALAMLALLARAQGDGDLAWSLIHEVHPLGPRTPPGESYFTTGIEMQRLAVRQAIEAGDLVTAHTWLESHDRWLAWSGSVLDQAEGRLLWAEYRLATSDRERAMEHARQALERASDPRQPLVLLAAHRLLGELDTVAGHFSDAAIHLDQALALADSCAAPYERALTLLAFAELQAAMDREAEIYALVDEARTVFVSLDAKPAHARANALLARLPPTVLAASDILTAREIEVLRLLAGGMTIRQIAEGLFLSPRTVERHITTIYRKVGARGRVDATAYAVHHGLLTVPKRAS